jgi:hypothetical protein
MFQRSYHKVRFHNRDRHEYPDCDFRPTPMQTANEHQYLTPFREDLQHRIEYYRSLVPRMAKERDIMRTQIRELELELGIQVIPAPIV